MWEVFAMDNGERHVIPADDLRLHDGSPHCWCFPRDDGGDLWVHNSADGREQYERHEKRAH
jgi:hypothetical protein